MRVFNPEAAVADAAQFCQMGGAAERDADIAGERTDIRSGRAFDRESKRRGAVRFEREPADLDPPRRRRSDFAAAPREIVEPHAVALERGEDRRHLFDRAREAYGDVVEPRAIERGNRRGANHRAVAIERVGFRAEPNDALVLLRAAFQKRRKPGALSDHDRQQAGGKRVERSQMADARRLHDRLDSAHDLAGGNSGGFVYEDDPVQYDSAHRSDARTAPLVFRPAFAQQGVDSQRALGARIEFEVQLGRESERELAADPMADESARAVEAGQRVLGAAHAFKMGKEDPATAEIVAHPNRGESDAAEPRVFHVAQQHLRELTQHDFRHALGPPAFRGHDRIVARRACCGNMTETSAVQ